jgi:hypothetical protein
MKLSYQDNHSHILINRDYQTLQNKLVDKLYTEGGEIKSDFCEVAMSALLQAADTQFGVSNGSTYEALSGLIREIVSKPIVKLGLNLATGRDRKLVLFY